MTNREYLKHIVSNDIYQIWLHRTHSSNIESILENGLNISQGDLNQTATLQPSDIEKARGLYNLTHNGSDAVVVVKIPREHIGEIHSNADITYFHPKHKSFYLQGKNIFLRCFMEILENIFLRRRKVQI